jgi:uncharacterized membrane protein YbhN (UPF0104 family)
LLIPRGHHLITAAAIFVAMVSAAAAYLGADEVWRRLGEVSAATVAGVFGLCLVNFMARALRWQIYAGRAGIAVPLARMMVYYIAGFSMSLTPGRVGELLRMWFMREFHGYRLQHAAPLFIADRVGDANAYLWMAIAALGVSAQHAGLAVVTAFAILTATWLLARPAALLWCVSAAYAMLRRWPRLFAGARYALQRGAVLFRPRVYVPTVALGVFGYSVVALALYVVAFSLGSPITLSQAMFTFAVSMLAGGISMMPGGLGGTDVTLFALLVHTGMSPESALTAAVLLRAGHLWFAVLLGFMLLPAAMRSRRERSDRAVVRPVTVGQ